MCGDNVGRMGRTVFSAVGSQMQQSRKAGTSSTQVVDQKLGCGVWRFIYSDNKPAFCCQVLDFETLFKVCSDQNIPHQLFYTAACAVYITLDLR
jgi:hypothetical protein